MENIQQHTIQFADPVKEFAPAEGLDSTATKVDVLDSKKLSKWILSDGLNVRLQIQLHKHIWTAETKGV